MFDDRLKVIICGEFESIEETADMIIQLWQAVTNSDKSISRAIKTGSRYGY